MRVIAATYPGPMPSEREAPAERMATALVHEAYARLRSDPAAWGEYQAELAAWDGTAGDGLDDARGEYPEFNW